MFVLGIGAVGWSLEHRKSQEAIRIAKAEARGRDLIEAGFTALSMGEPRSSRTMFEKAQTEIPYDTEALTGCALSPVRAKALRRIAHPAGVS
jgi:hypothetical protein